MVCCRHTLNVPEMSRAGGQFRLNHSGPPRKVSLTEHAQDRPPSESLAALARLLDQHATGAGRITPRPRGSRLSPDIRALLEEEVAVAEGAVEAGASLIFGNGCYAVGRHADASRVYLAVLEKEPSNADARFNLGLAYLRLRSPEDAVREFTGVLVQDPLLAEEGVILLLLLPMPRQ